MKPLQPGETTQESPSLDPADWEDFRRVAHELLDHTIDGLMTVRDRPLWQAVPQRVRAALDAPLPFEPVGVRQTVRDALELIAPYPTGNIHPRFFGWVHGTGTPGGMLAAMLTAGMNSNVGGRDHGAVYVERQVIEWCRQIFEFPQGASGILVSGTSMATLLGLAVARHEMTNGDVRQQGVHAMPRVAVYASSEAHISIAKALELLGLGRHALRAVPVDQDFRMDINALRSMIAEDRARGWLPLCVVATAGTVNTGSFDDINAVADICGDQKLWLHVDGAFGACVRLATPLAHLAQGVERADSLAFDFHKWLHVPYDAGCLLVRRGEAHLATFQNHADYLTANERALAGGHPWYCDFGPELSRSFRALKVWFTLREHGLQRLGQKIIENCAQAQRLAQAVNRDPNLVLAAPVASNVVCFRYQPPAGVALDLDQLNLDIVADLQEAGVAAPSTTKVRDKVVIRAALTNHRTTFADIDEFVRAVVDAGQRRLARQP